MVEQHKGMDLSTKYPYRQANWLLGQSFIKSELNDTLDKAAQARSSRSSAEYEKVLKNPPRFRFVSKLHSAVYDKHKRVIYEGTWNDPHNKLAIDNGVTFKDSDGIARAGHFLSCDEFVLRGLPQVKILIIDTMWNFGIDSLRDLNKKGYVVMGPGFKWLVQDPSDPKNYLEIPSSLSEKAS